MSRLKIYYNKSEIQTNLYTSGSIWMLEDTTEYIGLYHKYTTGEVYTQSDFIPGKSKKLIELQQTNSDNYIYKKLKPNLNIKFKTPVPYTVVINTISIESGVIPRYFLKKNNSKTIIEIDIKQYDDWKINLIDKTIYTAIRIFWNITGDKYDSVKNGIISKGVISKNSKRIRHAQIKLPGIENILTDPLQYYTDSDFIAPTDINGLDS